jgi:hypothetical protein
MAEGAFVIIREAVIVGRKVRPSTETNGRDFPVRNSAEYFDARFFLP